MTRREREEKKRYDALPEPLKKLQDLCYEAWTILRIDYPWYPQKYQNNQCCLTNDGFVQLRLQVLDHDGFARFRLMKTQEKGVGFREIIFTSDWIPRLRALFGEPDAPAEAFVGREISTEQLIKLVQKESDRYNSAEARDQLSGFAFSVKGSRPILVPLTHKLLPEETVLEDDHPVHWDYIYIVDGVVMQSPVNGTVLDLRRAVQAKEVRRYKIFHESRAKARIGDRVEA
jgi:hypothetical protein